MKLNGCRGLEAMVGLLLTKTADTNRFIRSDANAVLEAFASHLSLFKVITTLDDVGTRHKNGPARTATASLTATLVEAVGPEPWIEMASSSSGQSESGDMGPNRETVESVLRIGSVLLTDGNLDTRSGAKRIFAVLVRHPRFDPVIFDSYLAYMYRESKETLVTLNKTLDSIKQSQESG